MYITLNHLKKYKGKRGEGKQFRKRSFTNLLFKIFDDDSNQVSEFSDYQSSIFLSHKHGESEMLEQSILLLEALDVRVYIDWQDEHLPIETSGETAKKIKNKINGCQKFILLATAAAIESKWCNWELGIADAKKFPHNIAVMPIANDKGEWHGYEYLDIYPIIHINEDNEYCVEYNKKVITLFSWLKK